MADPAARARRRFLLNAIRQELGDWPTDRARRLYQANGWGCTRDLPRRDLRWLAGQRLLIEHGPKNARVYRLKHAHGRQTPTAIPNGAS
ncbi:hypothetical protein [Streptomyces kebangsaanensis]|uniref:hypothetical protein n=1 Tax=Streptomyces kebangsaanensis TaxID=864058 RepID=UPI00093E0B6A|nr:hypothetical protein [Streptomyces kebangsaanensis]